jgi:hypothetical protein
VTFPENLYDREKYILDRVQAGTFEAVWAEVTYAAGGYSAKFFVMEDALKIDGVRVNVSARLQQNLADLFDASLMTAQVADLVYISAARQVEPAPMKISSSVSSMIKHSSNVDAKLKLLPTNEGLVADPGKHWILDKKLEQLPGRACNYGWHFAGASYQGIAGFAAASSLNKMNGKPVKVIQPNATAHDALHSDYSQVCQLVSQICWVDGVEKRFSELLVDPKLSILVNHQGPLKITRQPGVPELTGTVVMFPTIITASSPIV